MSTFLKCKETTFVEIISAGSQIWVNLRRALCVMAINSNVLLCINTKFWYDIKNGVLYLF